MRSVAFYLSLFLVVPLVFPCCSRQSSSPVVASASALPSASQSAAIASSIPVQPLPPVAWRESVRLERWHDAAQSLDQVPELRSSSELRFVRARVASELKDHKAVIALLDGLDEKLPHLALSIAELRADAQIYVGPAEEAAKFFATQPSAEAKIKAARAFEKASRLPEARRLLDEVIRVSRSKTSDTALDAHTLRARIAQAQGDNTTALSDLRFIAKHDPSDDDSEVETTIGRLDPAKGLSRSDRVSRAMRFVRDGQSEKALSEIARALETTSDPTEKQELAFARATVLYRARTDYSQAAAAFDALAKPGSRREAEALFQSAKAWSRADKNDLAAQRYRDLVAKFPKTEWAERAAYNLARLKMLEASWAEAERAYDQYLKKYRKGANLADARYEHAICALLAGHKDKARKLLGAQLARSTSPVDVANATHLLALASRDDDYATAIESVAKKFPLSFVSLAARSRLNQKGVPSPAPIDPSSSTAPPVQPLALRLPALVETFRQLGLDRDAETYLFEHENEIGSGYGERSLEGLCGVYGTLVHARRRYRVGQRVSVGPWLDSAPSVSSRWLWECLYPQPYPALVADLEQRHALPNGLLYAIMRQESAFNPSARSPVGAVGLMQLMPNTARRISQESSFSFDPDDLDSPSVNLELSASYLEKLLKMLGGNLVLTVAAYNAGPKAVARWFDRAGKLPVDLWVARIPYRETRGYVHRVIGNLARYRYLASGEQNLPAVELDLPPSIGVPEDAY